MDRLCTNSKYIRPLSCLLSPKPVNYEWSTQNSDRQLSSGKRSIFTLHVSDTGYKKKKSWLLREEWFTGDTHSDSDYKLSLGSCSNLSSVLFHFSRATCTQPPTCILQGEPCDLHSLCTGSRTHPLSLSYSGYPTPHLPVAAIMPNSVLWFLREERLEVFYWSFTYHLTCSWASLLAQMVKNPPAMREDLGLTLGLGWPVIKKNLGSKNWEYSMPVSSNFNSLLGSPCFSSLSRTFKFFLFAFCPEYIVSSYGKFSLLRALFLLFSHSVASNSLWPHRLQHKRLPCFSLSPGVCSTHVHWVDVASQLSHPLSPPSSPALNLPQHQGLFQWVGSLHQVAKARSLHGHATNRDCLIHMHEEFKQR